MKARAVDSRVVIEQSATRGERGTLSMIELAKIATVLTGGLIALGLVFKWIAYDVSKKEAREKAMIISGGFAFFALIGMALSAGLWILAAWL